MLAIAEPRTLKKELPDWVFDILEDETDDRRFWITKGLGAGGTYGAAMWHYVMCIVNAGSPLSWAIAPTYTQVRDTLLPTFSEVLQREFGLVENADYEVIESGIPRIKLKRQGQEIHFKSANRPDRMVGPTVSHITGTEIGLWPRMAYEKSSARLRCPRAARRQYMGEGTPEGFNWWQVEADFPGEVDSDRNYRRVILETRDNRHLKPGYIANLERVYSYDLGKLRSYLHGVFVPFTKGTAYWEFFDSRNVKLDVQLDPALPIGFDWDFNKSPLAWVVDQRQPIYTPRGTRYRYVALAESEGTARGLMDACAEFAVKVPVKSFADTPIEIYGDPSGYAGSHLSPSCAYDIIEKNLKSLGYRRVTICAARKAPDIQDRLERANALFAYEMAVVAAWCRNTIKSLTTTCLVNGTWQIQKPKDDDWTHWADGWTYRLFQSTKLDDLEMPTRPKRYGLNA